MVLVSKPFATERELIFQVKEVSKNSKQKRGRHIFISEFHAHKVEPKLGDNGPMVLIWHIL